MLCITVDMEPTDLVLAHVGLSGLKDWDRIVRGDLKDDNLCLAAPENDCHRLYPCLKLDDICKAFPKSSAGYLTNSPQAVRLLWVNQFQK